MEKIEVTIQEEGIRLDKFLSRVNTSLTRSYAQKLIDGGFVLVNGRDMPSKYKIVKGDRIEVTLPEPEKPDIAAEDIPLDVVYEDESLLVINKPAGMVVHPSAGNHNKTLVNALLMHCGDKLSTINGIHRPGIVHRLDKDTSGLLIVAKGDEAHQSLSGQLKERALKRQYVAVVHGNIKEDRGTINKNIARSHKDRKKMAVTDRGGRIAVTNFKVLRRYGKYTLVQCNLDTGRTHQIRVHMKYIGHPVFGDKTYGIKNEEFNASGQLLHAETIGFIHPKTRSYMTFSKTPPVEFNKILSLIENKYKPII